MVFFKTNCPNRYWEVESRRSNKILEKSYLNNSPNVYQTYDFAQFLKNNKKFEKSISFYSNVLKNITQSHELYPKAKDGRGIAFEQTGKWESWERFYRPA